LAASLSATACKGEENVQYLLVESSAIKVSRIMSYVSSLIQSFKVFNSSRLKFLAF